MFVRFPVYDDEPLKLPGRYFFAGNPNGSNEGDKVAHVDFSVLCAVDDKAELQARLDMLKQGHVPGSIDLRNRTLAEYIEQLEAVLKNE